MCEELRSIVPRLYEQTRPESLEGVNLRFNTNGWEHTEYFLEKVLDEKNPRVYGGWASRVYGGWTETRLPGLVIISKAYVAYAQQGKGIGKYLAKLRCDAFNIMRQGYTIDYPCEDIDMICRVATWNEKQRHILLSLGWKQLSSVIWIRP